MRAPEEYANKQSSLVAVFSVFSVL